MQKIDRRRGQHPKIIFAHTLGHYLVKDPSAIELPFPNKLDLISMGST